MQQLVVLSLALIALSSTADMVELDDWIEPNYFEEGRPVVMHGFRVYIHHYDGNFSEENNEYLIRAMNKVKDALRLAVGVLPEHAIGLLRISTPIVMRDKCDRPSSPAYVSSGKYVRLTCFKSIASWAVSTQNEQVMIHELAHAWHHQYVPEGYDNQVIKDTFERAKTCEYPRDGYYWMRNDREYFAEMTVVNFWQHRSPPYMRGFMDLQSRAVIQAAWGVGRYVGDVRERTLSWGFAESKCTRSRPDGFQSAK